MLRYMYIACLITLTITDDVISSYYPFSMSLYCCNNMPTSTRTAKIPKRSCLYRCTVHFVVYVITHTNKCTYTVFNNLKFILKYLKRSYMFRSYDHPQGAYFVPC